MDKEAKREAQAVLRFWNIIDSYGYKEARVIKNSILIRKSKMGLTKATDAYLQTMEKSANMTYEEIGRELNISPAMAKQTCYCALAKLKQRLESCGIKCTDDFLN